MSDSAITANCHDVHQAPPLPNGNMALVVNKDGEVSEVMHAPEGMMTPESVDALWSAETGKHVRNSIQRVLRDRTFFSEDVDLDANSGSAELIYVAQGRDRVLLIVRDTSRHRQAMSRMRKLAFVDKVTGLPNREYYMEELRKVCEHQQLREGRAAVICIHVDDKHETIGADRYGAVLQEMAQRMVRELRGTNSLDDQDYERRTVVARIDFHRFAIVLPYIETGVDAESVTERLMQFIQQPIDVDGTALTTHVYAGIGLFPQDGSNAETLHTNTFAATEEARAGQPGNICFHSGTVKLRTLQRQDLEIELKTALESGSFRLNYLPIVDADSHDIRSVEALLRWPDSVMGSHSTSKIIGIAERTGLIVPIGEWVLRESFRQLRIWHDAGWSDLHLAINFSMQEFSRPDIASRMAALMLEAGIQPEYIDLEITEKMLARDALTAFQVLDTLKALGIQLHVDDYGTAACSLAQLSHSPIDGIKLDNSLVSAAESCAKDHAACQAAIASAHALGLAVIAEGVETQQQVDSLRESGCDMLQGFYFTTPLGASEMQNYFEPVATGVRHG